MSLANRIASVDKRKLKPAQRRQLVEDIAANVLAYWDGATLADRMAGREWYTIARDVADGIGRRHGITRQQAAALIAITSPQQRWETNVAIAESIADGTGQAFFDNQKPKTNNVMNDADNPGQYVSGPKVSAFYSNILGDETGVTVDTWAIRAAVADLVLSDRTRFAIGNTITRYDIVADGYRLAAERRNVTPAIMQATVWVIVRNAPDPNEGMVAPY